MTQSTPSTQALQSSHITSNPEMTATAYAPESLTRESLASAARRASVYRPPRPMLARDADSVFWMSRYVERAEHVARLLSVSGNLLMDVADLAPALERKQWQSVLRIMHLGDLPADPAGPVAGQATPLSQRIPQYMVFSADNPCSVYNCLTRARENARAIRETISAEMWQEMNALYWFIRAEDIHARFEESREEVYDHVMRGSMLFQGMTDQTLPHDQRWLFAQVGKCIERVDVTCRVIATKFDILRPAERSLEAPIRNIHWMAVLRSCCSIEAYRRKYVADMDPLKVVSFLILEPNFPRSIRFAVAQLHAALVAIRQEAHPNVIDPAERLLGRLDAQLEYAELSEILGGKGLPNYLEGVQGVIAEAALAVQRRYFLH